MLNRSSKITDTSNGLTTLTYDLNGNLTTAADAVGTATYTWDVRNRLTGLTSPGFNASFAYDSVGRRTGKTVQGVTTNFVYDGVNPVQEKNGATVTANLLTGLGIDEFLTRTDGTGTRGLLTDALGSTVALGDNTGTVQTQYTYEPFGFTTSSGQASTNSYKYTGREDDGTGLDYYRARYYSPRLQRFVAEDPIEFAGEDVNLYAYVANNPINYTDPTGEFVPQLVACGVGAGISVGLDALSGRKPSLLNAGIGCLTAATGLRLAAELHRIKYLEFLNANRYFRIGPGRYGGEVNVPRIAIGPSPQNQTVWWGHGRLWP